LLLLFKKKILERRICNIARCHLEAII
jgi:hypothetical protein